MITRAGFRTTCSDCGENINIGDEIRRDLDGNWIHFLCPFLIEEANPLCPRCFTYHAGQECY